MTEDFNVNDLGFRQEEIPTQDPSDLPKESTRPKDPPQPGTYRLKLPVSFVNVIKPLESNKGERAAAYFLDENALEDEVTGQRIETIIDNSEYIKKDKRSGKEAYVSGMAYLLKALAYTGLLTSNESFAEALSMFPGHRFKADLTYNAYCNPKKKAWKNNKESDETGCGQSLEMEGYTRTRDGVVIKSIPQAVTGKYLSRFECHCGADLRVRTKLVNFRSI